MAISSVTPAERQNIYDRAMQMLSYVWITTKDLIGWRGLYIFKKGGSYLGIPYTQAADQVN